MTDLNKEQLEIIRFRFEQAKTVYVSVDRATMFPLLDMADRAEKAEARVAELEATCAELKEALEHTFTIDSRDATFADHDRYEHALSSDAGKGWLPPEEALALVRENNLLKESLDGSVGYRTLVREFTDLREETKKLRMALRQIAEHDPGRLPSIIAGVRRDVCLTCQELIKIAQEVKDG